MRLIAATSVRMYQKSLTAYAGPSSWPGKVPVGIYFDAAELAAIMGGRLAPSIEADLPSGGTATVCSGSLVSHALLEQEARRDDWREMILATRQADEAFGNAPKGYNWQAI
jgi:hypothetical protein